MDEEELQYLLMGLLESLREEGWEDVEEIEHIQTIENAHYLTNDKGLVLSFEDGKDFMLIVKRVK